MNKHRTLLLAAAAIILVLAVIFLPLLLRGYTVNRADKAVGLAVPDVMSLYSADGIGFSFLFPEEHTTSWSESEGACVYCGADGSAPYILVCRTDKRGMSPKKYLKASDRLMLDSFSSVSSTPIQEVKLGDKTLYLTRYVCSSGSESHVIDRYVELYKDFYIQYSAVSSQAGELNTELYYAISTLRVKDGAYAGAYSDKLAKHSHDELGFEIKLPEMLVLKDLSLGYFASNENAVILCVYCTEDDTGKAIYNRKDFIDRAAESPDFVAACLGADRASFTEGSERSFGGKSFYCYPMSMSSDGWSFTGALCLANADETGCWLLCYAVRDGCPEHDRIQSLCQTCCESISFK